MDSDEYEEITPEEIEVWDALCRSWEEKTTGDDATFKRDRVDAVLGPRPAASWGMTGLGYFGRSILAAFVFMGWMVRVVVFYALNLVRPVVNIVCGGGAVLCLLGSAIMYFAAPPHAWLVALGFAAGFIVLNVLYDVLIGVLGIGLDTSSQGKV